MRLPTPSDSAQTSSFRVCISLNHRRRVSRRKKFSVCLETTLTTLLIRKICFSRPVLKVALRISASQVGNSQKANYSSFLLFCHWEVEGQHIPHFDFRLGVLAVTERHSRRRATSLFRRSPLCTKRPPAMQFGNSSCTLQTGQMASKKSIHSLFLVLHQRHLVLHLPLKCEGNGVQIPCVRIAVEPRRHRVYAFLTAAVALRTRSRLVATSLL